MIPTSQEKYEIIRSYARKFGIRKFIETGTHTGDAVAALLDEFDEIVTIELYEPSYAAACERFRNNLNVRCIFGDSGTKLPDVINEIDDPIIFWLDGHYCTDSETEIFTRRGWLQWDEVETNDYTLAINPETRLSEWQRVEEIYRQRVQQEPMILIEGKSFSSLTTPNHKWLVTNWQDTPYRFRTTETLRAGDLIPITAVRADNPIDATIPDELVEIVAWYFTEGCLHKGGIQIGQSLKANPEHVESIERCLTKLYGPAVSRGRSWSVNKNGSHDMALFYLAKPLAKEIDALAPNKVPTMDFLCSLTNEQLVIFIDTCINGDGRWGGPINFTQVNEQRIRAFEAACALMGRATSTSHLDIHNEKSTQNQWQTVLRTAIKVGPVKAATYNDRMIIERQLYDGIIWCPTLKYHNWLARRHGRVYFTGNSGGGTARGALDTPVVAELKAAVNAPHGSVILIDDARLFGGMEEHTEEFKDYPHAKWIGDTGQASGFITTIDNDIIRMVPKGLLNV